MWINIVSMFLYLSKITSRPIMHLLEREPDNAVCQPQSFCWLSWSIGIPFWPLWKVFHKNKDDLIFFFFFFIFSIPLGLKSNKVPTAMIDKKVLLLLFFTVSDMKFLSWCFHRGIMWENKLHHCKGPCGKN